MLAFYINDCDARDAEQPMGEQIRHLFGQELCRFDILGGVDLAEIWGMFEGKDRLICKSLFSWVHDGSHYAHDDLYLAIDDAMVEAYLKVSRAVFERSGHLAHYGMMMGSARAEEPATSVLHEPS